MEIIEKYSTQFWEMAITYLPKLAMAILTLIVGLVIINAVIRSLKKRLVKTQSDAALSTFLGSLFGVLLKAILLISVAAMIGIETTSFIAILGAAGLAIGLALQGSLSNFAGGVLILILKPFKIGDFINAQGHSGTVREIQIFNTVLKTPDNQTIILPNGSLSNGSLTNFSTEPTRRVEWTFGIGYEADIDNAKKVILNIIEADERAHPEPAPFIAVSELADSSVNLVVRVWCNSSDLWPLFFEIQEKVKKGFDTQKISIPYPQRDIHLFNH